MNTVATKYIIGEWINDQFIATGTSKWVTVSPEMRQVGADVVYRQNENSEPCTCMVCDVRETAVEANTIPH